MTGEMQFFDDCPSAVETADGVFLVAPDGTILERLTASGECMNCYDDVLELDEATGLCVQCYEQIIGINDDTED